LIIAHRGGKFWEDTNFSYISTSIRDGADIIELDVRRQGGRYVIQHDPFSKAQGTLEAALARIERAAVYLDVKTNDIDINDLIAYVRLLCSNHIIVGSFNYSMLQNICDRSVERNLHCWGAWLCNPEKFTAVDWINPICYFTSRAIAKRIQVQGFRFVPAGNQVFKKNEIMENQLRFARWGAYAIATHHVREMRELLRYHL
jgi:hypothetical protein